MTGFWDDAEIISFYSRAQAIEDGVLVPTTTLVKDEPDFARQAGFQVPVALTTALADLVIPTEREAREEFQDVKGRLWDVLNMARLYGARAVRECEATGAGSATWYFPCIFVLADRENHRARRKHRPTIKLKAVLDGDMDGSPVVTLMLASED